MDHIKIRNWMRIHKHLYRDANTGELNNTRLAEEAGCALDLYNEDGFNVKDILYEISAEFD